MLAVVLQWLYLFFLAYALGFLLSRFCEKCFGYQMKQAASCLMGGMIILTVYAQIFSLFYKVGVLANIVILVIALLSILWQRKQFTEYLSSQWKGCSKLSKIVMVILFFVWAYCTTRGYMVYDTALYHGQSIRWIEEYGVVTGLGNLHERFAYNSSVFALYALLSMKFVTGGIPLHTANGFFALILSMSILKIGHAWKRKKLHMSDYARIGAVYYLTTICDEVVAPSSDYPVMIVLFFIFITWLECLEQQKGKETVIAPYCLLCVAGVYALTLKVTAGLVLILLIKPAVYLLKNKKWKEIGIYLLLGLLVAVPWMARSVIISGWLFYPQTVIDLFPVDWKILEEIIQVDAAQIITWGRALYRISAIDYPITEWFPNWFATTLSTTEKLLIIADIVALPVLVIATVVVLVRKKWQNLDMLLVLGAVTCSYAYWQTSAPLMRYGYTHVLLMALLTYGWLMSFVRFKAVDMGIRALVLLIGIYKAAWFGQYVMSCSQQPYYIWQQDYEVFELEEKELDGHTIYTPVDDDRTGYYSFPSVPMVPNIEMRGDGFEDGFRPKK